MAFVDGFSHYDDLTYKYSTVAGSGATVSGASYGRPGFRVAELGTIGKRTHAALVGSPATSIQWGCDIWIGATGGDGVALTITTTSNGDLGTVTMDAGTVVTAIGAESASDSVVLPTEDWTYLGVFASSTTISGLRHYFIQVYLNGTLLRTLIATASYSGSARTIDHWTLAGTNCYGSHLREDVNTTLPITVITLYPDTQLATTNFPTVIQWDPGGDGNAELVDGTLAGTLDNITAGPLTVGTSQTWSDIYSINDAPLASYDEGDFPISFVQFALMAHYVATTPDDDLRMNVYSDDTNFRADTIVPLASNPQDWFIRTVSGSLHAPNGNTWDYAEIGATAIGPTADIANIESDYYGVDQVVAEVALLGRATPIVRRTGGFAWVVA